MLMATVGEGFVSEKNDPIGLSFIFPLPLCGNSQALAPLSPMSPSHLTEKIQEEGSFGMNFFGRGEGDPDKTLCVLIWPLGFQK